MSTIILSQPYRINGVVDTAQTVLQNLNNICTASGCWLTYDISTGKWCVVINKTGTSVASFNDSNIIGSINVSGTGVNELYNSVSVEFPHADLRDQKDYVDLEIPSADRFENEVDNKLNIQTDLINDPITAQYMGNVELKQSRVDKIIEFRTDYSKISLKAGDLIDVTSSMYGYTNKVFRIIKVEEEDGDALSISITALEYDANIYSTSGLIRTERTKRNGILIKTMNPAITASEESNFSSNMLNMLLPLAGTGLLNMLFSKNPITKKLEAVMAGPMTVVKATSVSGSNTVCEGQNVTFTVTTCRISSCVDYSTIKMPYEITGVTQEDIDVPLTGEVDLNAAGTGSLTVAIAADSITEGNETLTFTAGGQSKSVTIKEAQTITYSTSALPTTITEGESSIVTLTTSGVPDGTVVPYVISGTATSKVTTPLTGNVTITTNTATLTINTTDDEIYTGTKTLTVTFNSGMETDCGTIDNTAGISVLDNESAPPADTTCQTVAIPVVWCPVYDGTTGLAKSMSVVKSATVLKAISGQPSVTVPGSVTVSEGVVTVASTVDVDASTGKPGLDYNVITTFNTIPANGPVTGTTTVVRGY